MSRGVSEEKLLRSDTSSVYLALEIMEYAHRNQKRDNGEDYANHPTRCLGTYRQLIDIGPDVSGRAAGDDWVVILLVALLEVVGNLEPGESLIAYLHTHILGEALVGVGLRVVKARVVVDTAGDVVVELFRGTRKGKVVGLAERIFLI